MASNLWSKVYGLLPFALNAYDTRWHLTYLKNAATEDGMKNKPDESIVDAGQYFKFSVITIKNAPRIRQKYREGKTAADFKGELLADFDPLLAKLASLDSEHHVKEPDVYAYLIKCLDSFRDKVKAENKPAIEAGKTKFATFGTYYYLAESLSRKIDASADPAAKERVIQGFMDAGASLGSLGGGYDIGMDVIERALPFIQHAKNVYQWDGNSLKCPLVGITLTPAGQHGALQSRILFQYGPVRGEINPAYLPALGRRVDAGTYSAIDAILKNAGAPVTTSIGSELIPQAILFFKDKSAPTGAGRPRGPGPSPSSPTSMPKPPATPSSPTPAPTHPVQTKPVAPYGGVPVGISPSGSGSIQIAKPGSVQIKPVGVSPSTGVQVKPSAPVIVQPTQVRPAGPGISVGQTVKSPAVVPAPASPAVPASSPLSGIRAGNGSSLDQFYTNLVPVKDARTIPAGAPAPVADEVDPEDPAARVELFKRMAAVPGKPKEYYKDLENKVTDFYIYLLGQEIYDFNSDLDSLGQSLAVQTTSYDDGRQTFQGASAPKVVATGMFDPDLTK